MKSGGKIRRRKKKKKKTGEKTVWRKEGGRSSSLGCLALGSIAYHCHLICPSLPLLLPPPSPTLFLSLFLFLHPAVELKGVEKMKGREIYRETE